MEILTPEEIRALSSEPFRSRRLALWEQFREVNKALTVVAKEIKKFEENCPHRSKQRTDNNCAWFCPDCGEYVGVDTSYSPETEEFFRKLREQA